MKYKKHGIIWMCICIGLGTIGLGLVFQGVLGRMEGVFLVSSLLAVYMLGLIHIKSVENREKRIKADIQEYKARHQD